MFNKYVLPSLAFAGVVFAVFYTVVQARQAPQQVRPLIEPPSRPSSKVRVIAGAGLIEAQKENIPIGTNVPGVVWEIFIKKGDFVKAGDPLFRIDDRELKAQLKVREAELSATQAQLHKLKAAP